MQRNIFGALVQVYISTDKHGTWVAQKIIECATTLPQQELVVGALKKHVRTLMQDQYGNYVVQTCLKMKDKNQVSW